MPCLCLPGSTHGADSLLLHASRVTAYLPCLTEDQQAAEVPDMASRSSSCSSQTRMLMTISKLVAHQSQGRSATATATEQCNSAREHALLLTYTALVQCCCMLLCRCMCGAPNCRGTMDTQPERFKDEGRRIEVWYDGDKAFYRGTVKKYSAGKQTHLILFDDGEKLAIRLQVGP